MISVIFCKLGASPEIISIPEKPFHYLKSLFTIFEAIKLTDNYILFCSSNGSILPFNRMVRKHAIFGSFVIMKVDSKGNEINFSSKELHDLIFELSNVQGGLYDLN